jgi:hypothetical protein
MRDALLTPRAVPARLLPALGGALVLLLALPLFLLLGWPLAGWGIATVLWVAVHAVDTVLARTRASAANLAASAVQVFALLFKSLGLLVVLFATVAANAELAVAAAITYALAYTLELGLSLLSYYGRVP